MVLSAFVDISKSKHVYLRFIWAGNFPLLSTSVQKGKVSAEEMLESSSHHTLIMATKMYLLSPVRFYDCVKTGHLSQQKKYYIKYYHCYIKTFHTRIPVPKNWTNFLATCHRLPIEICIHSLATCYLLS